VAGAAEGIGKAFSVILARQGQHLVMVDHHAEALTDLTSEIEGKYGVKTISLCLDLAGENAPGKCMEAIQNLDCRMMIYVPAFSKVRSFLSNSQEDLDRFIHLNCRAPMQLVHAFASHIEGRGPGGIILMSSLAGLIGPQFVAPYAGTRAFNIVLAEALFHEFSAKSIDILACCAGITSTPTYLASLPDKAANIPGILDAETVAAFALHQLGKKAICIPGWKNRFSYFILTRILSRKQASALVSKAMRKMYPGK